MGYQYGNGGISVVTERGGVADQDERHQYLRNASSEADTNGRNNGRDLWSSLTRCVLVGSSRRYWLRLLGFGGRLVCAPF